MRYVDKTGSAMGVQRQTAANKVENKRKKRSSYEKERQNTKERLMTKVKISKLQVLLKQFQQLKQISQILMKNAVATTVQSLIFNNCN